VSRGHGNALVPQAHLVDAAISRVAAASRNINPDKSSWLEGERFTSDMSRNWRGGRIRWNRRVTLIRKSRIGWTQRRATSQRCCRSPGTREIGRDTPAKGNCVSLLWHMSSLSWVGTAKGRPLRWELPLKVKESQKKYNTGHEDTR
jgi:hypothetical protein